VGPLAATQIATELNRPWR